MWRTLVTWLALLPLAVTGYLTVMACTALGARTSTDSIVYINAARNLAQSGRLVVTFAPSAPGQVMSLTHYPPGYPVFLAAPGVVGIDAFFAGRCLNAILLGLTILLLGHLLWRQTHNVGIAAFAAFLTLTAVNVLGVHIFVWSEPLFIALMLLFVLALDRYIEAERRRDLVLAGLCAGAAMLTRYAGAAAIAAGAVSLLLLARGERSRRLRDGGLYALAAGAPVLAWILWGFCRDGRAADRALSFHPPGLGFFRQARDTMAAWMFPERWPVGQQALALLGVAAAVFGLGALFMARRRRPTPDAAKTERAVGHIALLILVCYVLLILVTVTFLDAGVEASPRILLPVFIVGVIVGLSVAYEAFRVLPLARRLRYALAIAVALLALRTVAPRADHAALWIRRAEIEGCQYLTSEWRTSPLLQLVAALGPDVPVYTNACEAIYFITGRTACTLPHAREFLSGAPNPRATADLVTMRRALAESRGYVAWFARKQRSDLVSLAELQAAMPLTCVRVTEDGFLFQLADGGR